MCNILNANSLIVKSLKCCSVSDNTCGTQKNERIKIPNGLILDYNQVYRLKWKS